MKKYEVGDIVFVSKYKYNDGNGGQNHLFVIIDEEDNLVPIEYFGMIVSSRIEKSKQNSIFKFNEPLKRNKRNNYIRRKMLLSIFFMLSNIIYYEKYIY